MFFQFGVTSENYPDSGMWKGRSSRKKSNENVKDVPEIVFNYQFRRKENSNMKIRSEILL